MAEPLALVFAVFAVYRLATDLALEDGPLELYAHGRGRVIARFGPEHWLSEGVCCPICLSFWIALPAAFVWGVLAWLAITGAVALLVRAT